MDTCKYSVCTEGEDISAIVDIGDLDNSNERLHCTYIHEPNMKNIIEFNLDDLSEKLEKKDIIILKAIRNSLLDAIHSKFPDYLEKSPIERRSMLFFVNDIITLGNCLYKENLTTAEIHEKLKTIYVGKKEEIVNNEQPAITKTNVTTELSNLILRVNRHQEEIEFLKIENDELSQLNYDSLQEIRNLRRQNVQFNNRLNTVGPRVTNTHEELTTEQETDSEIENVPEVIVPETTSIFIGCINNMYSRENIKTYIWTYANTDVELKDIQEIVLRNSRKAFKVTIPQVLLHKILTIWPAGIKAEPFSLPTVSSEEQPRRPNRNSRNNARNRKNIPQSFRGSNRPHSHGQNQNRQRAQTKINYQRNPNTEWGPRNNEWGPRNIEWGPRNNEWGPRNNEWGPEVSWTRLQEYSNQPQWNY